MDALTTLQAALDRATTAVADFDVEEATIGAWSEVLASREFLDRAGYEAAAFHTLLLEVAECHDDLCDEPDCCECTHLSGGIALLVASLRLAIGEELEHRVSAERGRRPRPIIRPEE